MSLFKFKERPGVEFSCTWPGCEQTALVSPGSFPEKWLRLFYTRWIRGDTATGSQAMYCPTHAPEMLRALNAPISTQSFFDDEARFPA